MTVCKLKRKPISTLDLKLMDYFFTYLMKGCAKISTDEIVCSMDDDIDHEITNIATNVDEMDVLKTQNMLKVCTCAVLLHIQQHIK